MKSRTVEIEKIEIKVDNGVNPPAWNVLVYYEFPTSPCREKGLLTITRSTLERAISSVPYAVNCAINGE